MRPPPNGAGGLSALRSLLFLPATATHLLAKAAGRGADALILDLEDAVPAERKAEARVLAAEALAQLAGSGLPVLLRVNAGREAWLQDIAAMPLQALAAVMLPKVERPGQVTALAQALDAAGAAALPVAALIESPLGVLASAEIARHPRLAALGFGAEDHAAALGVAPTPQALAWPASQVVTCAHAYGLPCWGLAASVAEVADMEAFAATVRHARAIGFTGSVCIHPRQVPVVNEGFSPTADELAWARRVVEADAAARAQGQGALIVDGRMVDKPIVDRARRWLAP
ncbi:CoA ester lyase [Aquincola sp. MAHUQ-54]|uniref:CoA ester lyase n=1 Tax=Aquincola agrisoli TaxID=3119538 RepID=A0AAW9PXY0_9BURK